MFPWIDVVTAKNQGIVVGKVVGSKYRLGQLLATGGMGSVWTARHIELETEVAVKFMSPELLANPDLRKRFGREAKAAAKLRSPHVVQILDYGIEDDAPYIVMELLDGEDLGRRLKRQKALPIMVVNDIVHQCCKALHLSQREGIVHRDLKPANVFLARSGDDEVVKVLDFGIAKSIATLGDATDEHTNSQVLMGSPQYMSPEQVRSEDTIDHRSDLWSLAVVAFRAVTGMKPFRGSEVGRLVLKIAVEPHPLATSICATLPPSIDQFFEKALAKEPDHRFQTARDFARAFSKLTHEALGIPAPLSSQSGTGMRSWDDASTTGTVPQVAMTAVKSSNTGSSKVLAGVGIVAVLAAIGIVTLRSPTAPAPASTPVASTTSVETATTVAPAPTVAPTAASSAESAPSTAPSASQAPSAESSSAPAPVSRRRRAPTPTPTGTATATAKRDPVFGF